MDVLIKVNKNYQVQASDAKPINSAQLSIPVLLLPVTL
jgi:hypothetical protein